MQQVQRFFQFVNQRLDGQAALFVMALVTLALNFAADLLYGVIDPRVTYE